MYISVLGKQNGRNFGHNMKSNILKNLDHDQTREKQILWINMLSYVEVRPS